MHKLSTSFLLLLALVVLGFAGCDKDEFNISEDTQFPPVLAERSIPAGFQIGTGIPFAVKAVWADAANSPLMSGSIVVSDDSGAEIASESGSLSGLRDSVVLEYAAFGVDSLPLGRYTINYTAADSRGQTTTIVDTLTISTGCANNSAANWAIIGDATANGWDSDTDMEFQGCGIYTIKINLTDNFIKFRRDDAWDVNYGGATWPGGDMTLGGDDIAVAEPGCYLVTLDITEETFTAEPAEDCDGGPIDIARNIGILSGSFGSLNEDMDLEYLGDSVYQIEVELGAGPVLFRENDAWDTRWGGESFPMGDLILGGTDIIVDAEGTYLITFDLGENTYNFELQEGEPDWGILGTAVNGGFDEDIDMTAEGDGIYTITLDLVPGEAKFRLDDAWDVNYGGTTFPSGDAILNGDNIVVDVAGTYNITLDVPNETYNFELRGEGDDWGIIGTAVNGGFDEDVDMTFQSDGVYTINLDLTVGEVKFRRDNAWDVNYGGTSFPSGDAVLNGDNLVVDVAGNYTVTLDVTNETYNFELQAGGDDWGIIGTAVNGGFDEDIDMTFAGNGVYTITLDLTIGEAKFRRDNAWDVNYGGTSFPSGDAVLNGDNLMVDVAGTYDITLDVANETYSFVLQSDEGDDWGIIGTAVNGGFDEDIDMTFAGNDVYTITLDLTEGEVKFRRDNAWDVNYGGTSFPSGDAVPNGDNLIVEEPGTYVVTLDVANLTYNFELQDDDGNINSVGIIGDATPTGWDSDTDMTDQGDGVYTIMMTLGEGEVKFRANDAWDIAWGTADENAPEFPMGTAAMPGFNIPVVAGTYLITLDTENLTYNFEAQ